MTTIDWDDPEIKKILIYEENGCYKNPIRWILRKFLHVIKKANCQIFLEGHVFPELGSEEKIYGVLNNKYFFTPLSLFIKEPNEIIHILWNSIIKIKELQKVPGRVALFVELSLKDKRKVIVNYSELHSAGNLGDIGRLFDELIFYFSSIPKKIVKCKYKGPFDLQKMAQNIPADLRDCLFYKNSNELIWQKMIVCPCGSKDHFKIKYNKNESIEEEILDALLECEKCKKTTLLFDSEIHGWNALLDLEESKIEPSLKPQNYYHTLLKCSCGNVLFSLLAEAEYSNPEEIQEIKKSLKKIFGKEKGEVFATYSFGNFEGTAICKKCQKKHSFLSCECA